MNILAIILGHRFGICASISIAAIFWLLTGTVAHCWSVGDGIGSLRCKSDILITFLIEQQRWPYMHTPFLGYWESYDNKLAAVIFEPYSQFAIAAIISTWCGLELYYSLQEGTKRLGVCEQMDAPQVSLEEQMHKARSFIR